MNFSKSFIKIIQFGYPFLVGLGILGECVFYNKIGVKILRYSTIMDILISPIATLTDSPSRFIALLVLIGIIVIFILTLYHYRNKTWAHKLSGNKSFDSFTNEQVVDHLNNLFLIFLVLIMFSYFLGLSTGFGEVVSNRIKNKQAEYNTKLVFNNGETENVYLLHTNSMYNIYFSKGNKNVKIAPIGTLKNIEITNNPKLK